MRAEALLAAALLLAACSDPVLTIGRPGLGDGEFRFPRGVAASEHGLAVLDRSGRLQTFDLDGGFTGTFEVVAGNVRRGLPTGIAWLPDGKLVVADTHGSRLLVFDRGGAPVAHHGEMGTAPGMFLYPQRVNLDEDGNLVVAEYGLGTSNRVQVLAPDGRSLRVVGGPGEHEGGLGRPMAALPLGGGRVLVADVRAGLVVFAADGRFEGPFGRAPLPKGSLPYGLCRGPDGTVYCADVEGDRILRFAPGGEFRGAFGVPGSGAGEFREPWDVACSGGRLYVADMGNHRVQRIDPERVEWETP